LINHQDDVVLQNERGVTLRCRLHFSVGLASLAAFLATGLYMFYNHKQLHGLDTSTRLLFRSSHIYLLFTALLNLTVATTSFPPLSGWRTWLSRVGSALLLSTPVLCIVAFFREPWLTGLARPYVLLAVVGSLVGVVCHVVSWKPQYLWPGREL
jgi:hypothetical protein